MSLLRYRHTGIKDARIDFFKGNSLNLKLFFDHIHLYAYFDTIAANYHDTLPLIFGKWDLLKKDLGPLFLYVSFDFLFYT
jgi:hypothetical protein